MSGKVHCQNCGRELTLTLVDLGLSPLANSYVPPEKASEPDKFYPLHARVCENCLLVQVESVVPAAEIFSHYAYFSSYSDSWLKHVAAYADMVTDRFGLSAETQVMEIASNDGYLLQYFVAKGIPVLGIEPAANVAKAAEEKGVNTRVAFFGRETARTLKEEGNRPRLIAAKNVLAHVPDINDFVGGLAILMGPETVFTVEFPHLLNLIEQVQFDTIYHEHYTYLSLLALTGIFERHGLRVFDVEELSTHGGSLRVFACRRQADFETSLRVEEVRAREIAAKLDRREGYLGFEKKVRAVRDELLSFLYEAKNSGKKAAAYGAAAKGNTLLNYCGIGTDLIGYAVDRNPAKQNTYLPGSRIPVFPVEKLKESPVDYVLILPWNLKQEIMEQLADLRAPGGTGSRGCRFVTAIPHVAVEP